MLRQVKSYFVIDGRTKMGTISLLMIGGIIGSFMEAVGLSLIFPLINIIANPETITDSGYVNIVYKYLNMESQISFLVLITLAVVFVFVSKSTFMLWLYYLQAKFINRWQYMMADRIFGLYIYAPYSMHLSRNTADLIRNLGLTSSFYSGFVFSLMTLFTEMTVGLSIIVVLIYYSPQATMAIFCALCFITAIQYRLTGRFFARVGIDNTELAAQLQKCMLQSLGAVKETKILGRENYFTQIFHTYQKRLSDNNRKTQVVQKIPGAVNEITLMIIMGLSIIVVLSLSTNGTNTLATLGLLAAAAMRLLPLAAKILTGLNTLQSCRHAVQLLEADIINLNEKIDKLSPTKMSIAQIPTVPLSGDIDLKNISFTYPNADEPSLRNFSAKIKKGEFIGLVGISGSGKTTLADIILGLHRVQSGKIEINGIDISSITKNPHRLNAGYVAQTIYITDDTITRNIALGVSDDKIQMEKVENAIRLAHLHDFVSSLSQGAETVVGENGNRLSAGQRQRIGIARALYHEPDLLVLDEATSSLDAQTERDLTETFEGLKGQKTLLAIAHRLHTLKNCDRLIFLHQGVQVDSGSFNELFDRNEEFRKTVELGQIN